LKKKLVNTAKFLSRLIQAYGAWTQASVIQNFMAWMSYEVKIIDTITVIDLIQPVFYR